MKTYSTHDASAQLTTAEYYILASCFTVLFITCNKGNKSSETDSFGNKKKKGKYLNTPEDGHVGRNM
jgi:hypothetical protein